MLSLLYFFIAAGKETVEVYNTLRLTGEEQQNYEAVIKQFEIYTKPKKNIIVERFIFNNS